MKKTQTESVILNAVLFATHCTLTIRYNTQNNVKIPFCVCIQIVSWLKKKQPIVAILKLIRMTTIIEIKTITGVVHKQGSKLRPFWSHMLPKCNLCDSKIYLGAFVRVLIIAVVRPLQFSAKRSRITAQHVPRDRELKQVKLFIRTLV